MVPLNVMDVVYSNIENGDVQLGRRGPDITKLLPTPIKSLIIVVFPPSGRIH